MLLKLKDMKVFASEMCAKYKPENNPSQTERKKRKKKKREEKIKKERKKTPGEICTGGI